MNTEARSDTTKWWVLALASTASFQVALDTVLVATAISKSAHGLMFRGGGGGMTSAAVFGVGLKAAMGLSAAMSVAGAVAGLGVGSRHVAFAAARENPGE